MIPSLCCPVTTSIVSPPSYSAYNRQHLLVPLILRLPVRAGLIIRLTLTQVTKAQPTLFLWFGPVSPRLPTMPGRELP